MNFIDRIFIGELTSTVMCEECANVGTLEFTSTWNRLWSHCFYCFLSHVIICSHLFLFVTHDYIVVLKSLLKIYPSLLENKHNV